MLRLSVPLSPPLSTPPQFAPLSEQLLLLAATWGGNPRLPYLKASILVAPTLQVATTLDLLSVPPLLPNFKALLLFASISFCILNPPPVCFPSGKSHNGSISWREVLRWLLT
jgi:hypothetical protein